MYKKWILAGKFSGNVLRSSYKEWTLKSVQIIFANLNLRNFMQNPEEYCKAI